MCFVQNLKYSTYNIVAHGGDKDNVNAACMVKLPNNEVKSPAEVSSYILAPLKAAAEVYLKRDVNYAVITVPAYFTEKQRIATREVGSVKCHFLIIVTIVMPQFEDMCHNNMHCDYSYAPN